MHADGGELDRHPGNDCRCTARLISDRTLQRKPSARSYLNVTPRLRRSSCRGVGSGSNRSGRRSDLNAGHDRLFESAVYHRGRELGRGQGRSKKEAESHAALAALAALRDKPEDGAPRA